jgi:hypothetical protein
MFKTSILGEYYKMGIKSILFTSFVTFVIKIWLYISFKVVDGSVANQQIIGNSTTYTHNTSHI